MLSEYDRVRGVATEPAAARMSTRFGDRPAALPRYGLLLCLLGIVGCGTNQFEQELRTEEAAIKLAHETVEGGYRLISTAELKNLLESGEAFLLVDAMPASDSFDKGHIAGAVNFEFPKEPMDSWTADTMQSRQEADYESVLGADKDRKIVVYCGFVKCARSHNGAVFAQRLGYNNVFRYPGGIYAWRGAGHSLTTD